jgi:hypothetical protein
MLDRCFFQRDAVTCARELVGCKLTCGTLSGIVVETEAYDAEGDDACHTAFRPSARAFVSGHKAGAAYVYFSYGVHWMLNVLVKAERAGFVLIRALEPLEGIQEMKKARGVQDLRQLCSGPGKSSWQRHVFRREVCVFSPERRSLGQDLFAGWNHAGDGLPLEVLRGGQSAREPDKPKARPGGG